MTITPLDWITQEVLERRFLAARSWRYRPKKSLLLTSDTKTIAWIEETIYARALGEISDKTMMTRLKAVGEYTYMLPRHATVADSDGPSGTWHTIHNAVYDRVITRDEYAELRDAVRVYDPRPPEE